MTNARVEEAYAQLDRGNERVAVGILEGGGQAGDHDCLVELAVWYLDGRYIRRDLTKSRECFRLAGALGHDRSQRIYIALLANGVGGTRDWAKAVQLLSEHAEVNADSARELDILRQMHLDHQGLPLTAATKQLSLSSRPEVCRLPELLTPAECMYLIERALPLLQPSVITDPATGEMRSHPVRTSENAVLPWVDETPAIHAINQRIARSADLPAENGEPLQVLRYRPGQEFRPHYDALPATENQRVLTVLVYLNDGYTGGETEFCMTGLTVSGCLGEGLMFTNTGPTGAPDRLALHAGRMVTSGEKLLATRWIREKPFGLQ